jgi:hypothetical protein
MEFLDSLRHLQRAAAGHWTGMPREIRDMKSVAEAIYSTVLRAIMLGSFFLRPHHQRLEARQQSGLSGALVFTTIVPGGRLLQNQLRSLLEFDPILRALFFVYDNIGTADEFVLRPLPSQYWRRWQLLEKQDRVRMLAENGAPSEAPPYWEQLIEQLGQADKPSL